MMWSPLDLGDNIIDFIAEYWQWWVWFALLIGVAAVYMFLR